MCVYRINMDGVDGIKQPIQMTFVRHRADGLFVCNKVNSTNGYFKKGALGRNDKYVDIFLVRARSGQISLGVLSCPQFLVGKKIRLRVEIVKDGE